MNNNPIFKFAIREDLKDSGIIFLPERAEPYSTGWDVKAAQSEPLFCKNLWDSIIAADF